jgi:ribosome biogenesis GTPase
MKGNFESKELKVPTHSCGDIVDYELESSDTVTGTIHNIHERKNYIVRKSVNLSHQMAIASNNDGSL